MKALSLYESAVLSSAQRLQIAERESLTQARVPTSRIAVFDSFPTAGRLA